MKTAAVISVSIGLLAACGASTWATPAQPSDWVRECPGEAVCFSRPPSLVLRPSRAIDSLSADYRSDSMQLLLDLGRYGTSVAHLASAPQERVTIDGRAAVVYSGEQEVMLVVPEVYSQGPVKLKFSMTLKFSGKAAPETAKRIFQTIEFKPPR